MTDNSAQILPISRLLLKSQQISNFSDTTSLARPADYFWHDSVATKCYSNATTHLCDATMQVATVNRATNVMIEPLDNTIGTSV